MRNSTNGTTSSRTEVARNSHMTEYRADELYELAEAVATGASYEAPGSKVVGKNPAVSMTKATKAEKAQAKAIVDFLTEDMRSVLPKSHPLGGSNGKFCHWDVDATPDDVLEAINLLLPSLFGTLEKAGVVLNTQPDKTQGGGLHTLWRLLQQKQGLAAYAEPSASSGPAPAAAAQFAAVESKIDSLTETVAALAGIVATVATSTEEVSA